MPPVTLGVPGALRRNKALDPTPLVDCPPASGTATRRARGSAPRFGCKQIEKESDDDTGSWSGVGPSELLVFRMKEL